MKNIAQTLSSCSLGMMLLLPGALPAASQQKNQAAAKPEIKKFEDTLPPFKSSTFSGSETRVHYLSNLQSNCSTGERPDVRVVKNPENGGLRFDPIRHPVNQKVGTPLAHCNGKEVDVLGVFYKSKDGFVGEDRMTIEVNYKTGFIHRYSYIVDVR